MRKIESAVKKAESRIAELESEIERIDSEFEKPEIAINSAKLNELTALREACQTELSDCYNTWEELSLQMESD